MFGRPIHAAVMVVAISAPALGLDWTTKMFETTSHDFGTVARGERAEYEFVLENLYVEDVHIAAVRASCTCTTPEKTTKQIVVRGTEPFRVTEVTCEGTGFKVTAPDATTDNSLHMVPVTFVAAKESGRVETTIHIETSLGTVTPITAYANVVAH